MIIQKMKALKRAIRSTTKKYSPEYERAWQKAVEPIAVEIMTVARDWELEGLRRFALRTQRPIKDIYVDAVLYEIDDWIDILR